MSGEYQPVIRATYITGLGGTPVGRMPRAGDFFWFGTVRGWAQLCGTPGDEVPGTGLAIDWCAAPPEGTPVALDEGPFKLPDSHRPKGWPE